MKRLQLLFMIWALYVSGLCGCVAAPPTEALAINAAQISDELRDVAPFGSIDAEIASWIRELPPLESPLPPAGKYQAANIEVASDGSWFSFLSPQFHEARKRLPDPNGSVDSPSHLLMFWQRDGNQWRRVSPPRFETPTGAYSSGRVVTTVSGRAYRFDGGALVDLGIPPGGTTCAVPSGFVVTVRPIGERSKAAYVVETRVLRANGQVDMVSESPLDWRREPPEWPTFVLTEGGSSMIVCSSLRVCFPDGRAEPWSSAHFKSSSMVPGGAVVTWGDDIVRLNSDAKVQLIADLNPPSSGRHFVYSVSPTGKRAVIQRPTWGFLGTDVNAFWLIDVRPGMSFPTMSGTRIGFTYDKWFVVESPERASLDVPLKSNPTSTPKP
ncbi:MAG: hypothetical protein ACK5Z4_13440 [Planctomyces sp.]